MQAIGDRSCCGAGGASSTCATCTASEFHASSRAGHPAHGKLTAMAAAPSVMNVVTGPSAADIRIEAIRLAIQAHNTGVVHGGELDASQLVDTASEFADFISAATDD